MRRATVLDFSATLLLTGAFLLLIFGAASALRFKELTSFGSGFVLIGAEMRVPQDEGSQFVKTSLSAPQVRLLGSTVGPDARLGAFRVQDSIAQHSGHRLPIRLVTADAEFWSLVGLGAGSCVEDALYLNLGSALVADEVTAVVIDQRSFIVRRLDLGWIGLLTGGNEESLAIRCSEHDSLSASADFVLVRESPLTSQGLARASALPDFRGEALFSSRLRSQRLDAALGEVAAAEFGWVPGFLRSALGLPILVAAGWALLRSVADRRTIAIRQVLGAMPSRVLLDFSKRVALSVVLAFAMSTIAFVLLSHSVSFSSWDRVGYVLASWHVISSVLFASLAALLTYSTFTLASWEKSLSPSTLSVHAAGSAAFLLAWVLGIVLSSVAAASALSVHRHVQALEAAPLGMNLEGVWVVPVRFPKDLAANAGEVAESVGAMISRLESTYPSMIAGATCLPPWRFDGFAFIEGGDEDTGLTSLISDGVLRILDVQSGELPGFQLGPGANPKAMVLQARTDQERQTYRRFFNVEREVAGVRVGTYSPVIRTITFRPLGSLPCQDMDLVFRADFGATIDTAAIQGMVSRGFPSSAVGSAKRVADIYSESRAHITELRTMLGALLVVAIALQAALTIALAINLAATRAKSLAVRFALGCTARRAATELLLSVAPWAAVATVLVLLGVAALDRILASAVVDWTGMSALGAGFIVIGLTMLSAAALILPVLDIHSRGGAVRLLGSQ